MTRTETILAVLAWITFSSAPVGSTLAGVFVAMKNPAVKRGEADIV